MWTADEIQDVTGLLSGIMENLGTDERRAWFAQMTSGDFKREMNRLLTTASNYAEWAEVAVRVCLERGWADTPPWAERLLKAMDADPQLPRPIANLPAMLARIGLGKDFDPRLEASQAELVANDVPFLDRTFIRDSAKELLEEARRRILVLSGQVGSGRSYCSELFQYISRQSGYFFKIARVAIEPGQGASYTPKLLALNIAGEMNSSDKPDDIDPAHRTIEPYKSFILTTAEKSGFRWWIVLDGFNDLPPENDTRKLIQALATSIANERDGERLRLILADYSGFQLNRLRYNLHTMQAQDIQKQHIRSYFDKLRNKHKLTLTNDELDAFAEGIWANLPPAADRLEVLNQLVTDLAVQVLTGGGRP